jgi:L-malate glycosyltransferase
LSAHFLHVFATFAPGGPQVRGVQLIAGLGSEYRHSILAMDGHTDARNLLGDEAEVRILEALPPMSSPRRVRALMRLIGAEKPTLLLTYNWGSIEAVAAARLLRRTPFLHHEDGFLPDEVAGFKKRRILARRHLLRGATSVVVPSRTLEEIATEVWKLPRPLVHLIPNGIHLEDFPADRSNPELRGELGIPPDAVVVGSVGHLRPEKNPVRAVEAFAAMRSDAHLLLVGDGPEREAVERTVRERGLEARVHLVGHQEQLRSFHAAMDLFVISSDTEQMPVALLEAMASGLGVASTDVGDVAHMLGAEQREFIVPLEPTGTSEALGGALDSLARDEARRRRLGRANRSRVEERYSFDSMLAAHRERYDHAIRSSR